MGEKIKINALGLRSYHLFVVGGRSFNVQESLAAEGDINLPLVHSTLAQTLPLYPLRRIFSHLYNNASDEGEKLC